MHCTFADLGSNKVSSSSSSSANVDSYGVTGKRKIRNEHIRGTARLALASKKDPE